MSTLTIINMATKYSLLGVIIATTIISIFLIGHYFIYKKIMKGRKKLKPILLLLWSLLLIYFIIVLGITIICRKPGTSDLVNLELFTSYKYAWYGISSKEWRNIILNILMFVPFGFILPLVSKKCEKFYITYLTSFFITISIEIIQLVSKRGVFELDDIMNNMFGAMIGYGFVMLYLSLLKKNKNFIFYLKIVLYQLPLVIAILFFSLIFHSM